MPYGRTLCGDLMETSFFSLVLEYKNTFVLFQEFFSAPLVGYFYDRWFY